MHTQIYARACTNTFCTHTRTHTHTHTNTYTHTRRHAHAHTNICVRVHTCTCTHTSTSRTHTHNTRTHTCTRALTHTHAHVCTHIRTHTCTHSHTHSSIHARAHTHARIYIHAAAHTYTQTHACKHTRIYSEKEKKTANSHTYTLTSARYLKTTQQHENVNSLCYLLLWRFWTRVSRPLISKNQQADAPPPPPPPDWSLCWSTYAKTYPRSMALSQNHSDVSAMTGRQWTTQRQNILQKNTHTKNNNWLTSPYRQKTVTGLLVTKTLFVVSWVMADHEIKSEAGVNKSGESLWRFCRLHCSLHIPEPRLRSRLPRWPHLINILWDWSLETRLELSAPILTFEDADTLIYESVYRTTWASLPKH